MYDFVKRALDILVAFLLLVPTLILLPVIALAIKLDSDGPVLYRQKRVGKDGKEFWLLKFRSMVQNAEALGGLKGKVEDPRNTRVGTFLRKNYLDELPQIWNVFKGEMSFVGPRPERPEYIMMLKKMVPDYEKRLEALPGLTGLALVSMENDASVEDAPEKIKYDLYYIQNRSLWLDLKILFKTIFIILRRQGR